ncbi:MAG: ABC transporter permease [Aestuariivirga sp.]|uniref:ABC transporter permease n=1 Tax=Aestuariivirga sp. TaxID=2650926 RepID=UPI00301AACD4
MTSHANHHTVITPSAGNAPGLADMWDQRELLYYLALRDVSVRYKQTVLGIAWAFLQPVLPAIVFTVFFGNLAKMPSEGIPYALFSFAGLLPWTFFSSGVSQAATSLVNSTNLFTKVYFPRVFIPLASIVTAGFDALVSSLVLVALMLYFRVPPSANMLFLPLVLAIAVAFTIGTSAFLSAFAIRYRDVRYIIPFMIQMLLFLCPVAYPASIVPEKWRLLWAINPMVAAVEGFRWSILGTPLDLRTMLIGGITAPLVLVLGVKYFQKVESTFADVA